jgi:multicomponent Na+:H+ antiporter subunit E
MALFPAFFLRAAALYFIWWVLIEGDPTGLVFGAAIVVPVSILSCRFYPPSGYRLHLPGTLAFARYFIVRSAVAGVDVARRLLAPTVKVNPGYLTVSTCLPAGSPRWLLANTLSLMPGTLSVQVQDNSLELHCLDLDLPVAADVRATEQQVAGIFGLSKARGEETLP